MRELTVGERKASCDLGQFHFETTSEVKPFVGLIGQERAVEAICLGLAIESSGFNVCVVGPPGTGRATAVHEYIESVADERARPVDWCYVNNFKEPQFPQAISLPAGEGVDFKRAFDGLIRDAKDRIPRIFQSEDYVKRRAAIIETVQRHHA